MPGRRLNALVTQGLLCLANIGLRQLGAQEAAQVVGLDVGDLHGGSQGVRRGAYRG